MKGDFGYITIRVTLGKTAILSHGIVNEFINKQNRSVSDLLMKYALSARPFAFYVLPEYTSKFSGLGTKLFNILIEYCKHIRVTDFMIDMDQSKNANGKSFYRHWGLEENDLISINEISTFDSSIELK